ncbi:hypothetical protein [Candidatus Hepatobacter penaei]|uniref:hypothetical protein n=1 Tax=Candidatus Hepatobacter penaei TaxID=1274402 RepID=UPI0004F24E4B|nr:hypothetical protein [Candidatus Hepatobacter penaei]
MLKKKYLTYCVISVFSLGAELCAGSFKDTLDDPNSGWAGEASTVGGVPCQQVTKYVLPEGKTLETNLFPTPKTGSPERNWLVVTVTDGKPVKDTVTDWFAKGMSADYALDEGGLYRLFPKDLDFQACMSQMSGKHNKQAVNVLVNALAWSELEKDKHVPFLNAVINEHNVKEAMTMFVLRNADNQGYASGHLLGMKKLEVGVRSIMPQDAQLDEQNKIYLQKQKERLNGHTTSIEAIDAFLNPSTSASPAD